MHPADIGAVLKKSGHTQTTLAQELGVPRSTIYAVLHGKGRSRQVEQRISELTGLRLQDLWPQHYGGMPPDPGAGAVQLIDPQRLAWICHAIESAVEERLGTKGYANPRVLGLIYNQVLAKGRGSDDDVELAKAEVGQFLESLRALDIPDEQLAKRILRQTSAAADPPKGFQISGSGNQVAGRDLVAGTLVKIGKKK